MCVCVRERERERETERESERRSESERGRGKDRYDESNVSLYAYHNYFQIITLISKILDNTIILNRLHKKAFMFNSILNLPF